MKIDVRTEEAGSDAVKRFLAESGYKYSSRTVGNAVIEKWTKRGNEFAVTSMEYDIKTETVEFGLTKI